MNRRTFDTPEVMESKLLSAIRRSKNKRPTGADKLRGEVLQLNPGFSSSILYNILKTACRLGHIMIILRSGSYLPIYKRKGLPSSPSNYLITDRHPSFDESNLWLSLTKLNTTTYRTEISVDSDEPLLWKTHFTLRQICFVQQCHYP